MTAYRVRPEPPRAYSVALRAWPCDGCGEPQDVRHKAGAVHCEHCGALTEVLPEIDLRVSASPIDEESRQRALASQRDETYHLHPSVLRYASLLKSDWPEVRRLWGEARRAFAADRSDEDAGHRFFSLSFILLNELPSWPELELDRRAICEATAEMFDDVRRRQWMIGRLAIGAARAGDTASAKVWIERMDPRSANLVADSYYRLANAMVATAESRFPRVLDLLGPHPGMPEAHSVRTMMAVLRANAHEKLGAVDVARAQLMPIALKSASDLGTVESIVRRTPAWELCGGILPEMRRKALVHHASHLSGPGGLFGPLLALVGMGSAIHGVISGAWWLALASALVIAAGVGLWVFDRRRLYDIAGGGVLVTGRVISADPIGSRGARFRVTIEPRDLPPGEAVIEDVVPPPLTAETIVGLPFDGYWNPAHPHKFVKVTFQIAPEKKT